MLKSGMSPGQYVKYATEKQSKHETQYLSFQTISSFGGRTVGQEGEVVAFENSKHLTRNFIKQIIFQRYLCHTDF